MVHLYEYLWGNKTKLSTIRTERSVTIPFTDEVQEYQAEGDASDEAMAVDNDIHTRKAVYYDLSIIHSSLKTVPDLLAIQFYERQEYCEFSDFLEAQREENVKQREEGDLLRPILLTGQPGIGACVHTTFEGWP